MKLKVVLLLGFVLVLTMTTLPLLAQENHYSGTANSNPMVQLAENDQVKLTVKLGPYCKAANNFNLCN